MRSRSAFAEKGVKDTEGDGRKCPAGMGAGLAGGSRAVNNCARHLVWITIAALCCQPRAVGPSLGRSAGRGGEVPFVRSCQVGGFQPLALRVPAAWWAAWMDGGAWAGLEKKSWTRAVNAGNCRAKVGRVSAQDAQYAAAVVAVADCKPEPP